MLKKIGIVGGILLVALIAFIATRPDNFKLSRSIVINAPPEAAFAQVNDFHKWITWSPWDKMDGDNIKRTYSGSESGVGATYAWEGDKTGSGRMAIKESTPQKIAIDLDFVKPFPASNVATFMFAPSANGTTVTWEMSGPNTTMGKAMSLVFDMEKMVGPDFEKGLAAIKANAESNGGTATAN